MTTNDDFSCGALPPPGREWEIGLTPVQIQQVHAEMQRRVEAEREACANQAQELAHFHEGRAIACEREGIDDAVRGHRDRAAAFREVEEAIRARGRRS